MESQKLNVLIVEDDQELLRILKAVLQKLDVHLYTAVTVRQALQMLDETMPAVLLLDMKLPDAPGTDVITEVNRRGVACTIIVITAHGSVELAVEAMREGAYDFLIKPLDLDRLLMMVRHAIERHRLINQLDDFNANVDRVHYRQLHGSSPAMQRLYRGIQTNAAGGAPVLLVGSLGSEFLDAARTIHDEHRKGDAPFVTVSPEQIASPDILMILYGVEGNAGAFAEASGGTILLEGIHGFSRDAQKYLLEYFRTGKQPAGSADLTGHEPRIISWAYENLPRHAEAGGFEKDLFYALSTVILSLPPLRDRGDDILHLALDRLTVESHLQGKLVARIADDAEEALMRYHWPGNVAEIHAVISHGVANCKGATLRLDHLPIPIVQTIEERPLPKFGLRGTSALNVVRPLWITEQDEIQKALKVCGGNVLEAARLLEISPSTIYGKQRLWAERSN